MIRSMTGYGRERRLVGAREITVEIRAVNHRYFEFNARTPRAYGYLDEKLKNFLSGKVGRGKVEVSVSVVNNEGADLGIELNLKTAQGYLSALRAANEQLGLPDDVALSHIMRLPEVFTVRKTTEDEDEIWEAVKQVTETALEKFVSVRELEGEKLKEDISSRLDRMESLVSQIEERSPQVTELYRNRLFSKLKELLNDRSIDESRILTEAAIFADKTAVDEETVRLKSHIAQFRKHIASDEQIGKQLDFLVQEMNREANTTGSKCQDLAITRMVVDLKSEIEKIREQIQNIE